MRYTCDLPGFEDNYIEVSDRWTRGQASRVLSVQGDDYFKLISMKLTAVYLSRSDEAGAAIDPIDKPSDFSETAIEGVDYMVWRWFATAIVKGVSDLYSLGEAHASRWFTAQEKPTTLGSKLM